MALVEGVGSTPSRTSGIVRASARTRHSGVRDVAAGIAPRVRIAGPLPVRASAQMAGVPVAIGSRRCSRALRSCRPGVPRRGSLFLVARLACRFAPPRVSQVCLVVPENPRFAASGSCMSKGGADGCTNATEPRRRMVDVDPADRRQDDCRTGIREIANGRPWDHGHGRRPAWHVAGSASPPPADLPSMSRRRRERSQRSDYRRRRHRLPRTSPRPCRMPRRASMLDAPVGADRTTGLIPDHGSRHLPRRWARGLRGRHLRPVRAHPDPRPR